MADVKISALPATSTLSASDLVPVVQGGTTKALSPTTVGSNLVTLANPSAITFPKIAANNTVATESAATHRVSIGLDQRTGVADTDYNVLATDRVVSYTTLSAARVVNLPAASAFNPGQEVIIGDTSGSCSATKTITITRAGADTIDGATTEVIAAAYGKRRLISDGVSKWGFDKGVLRASNNLSDVTTAATARSNLSAAASGANADITSMSALDTLSHAVTNSTAGAASTPALKLSGTPFAGTGTTSFPLLYVDDAAATASTVLKTAGTYLGINGHGTQDLANFLQDGVSKFKVDSSGQITSVGQTCTLDNTNAQLMLANGAGANKLQLYVNQCRMHSAYTWAWSNGTDQGNTLDTGFLRQAPGVVEFNDGTAGHSGVVLLRGRTITNLPASPIAGMHATITDGDSGLAWGATAINSGSGGTTYHVWYNGAAWTVVGK